jgi:hypothetical protein
MKLIENLRRDLAWLDSMPEVSAELRRLKRDRLMAIQQRDHAYEVIRQLERDLETEKARNDTLRSILRDRSE